METQGFRYDFTPAELKYMLFGKKTCPSCGGPMEKQKEYEIRPGSDFPTSRNPVFADNDKVRHFLYFFMCKDCGAKYPLSELAGGEKR